MVVVVPGIGEQDWPSRRRRFARRMVGAVPLMSKTLRGEAGQGALGCDAEDGFDEVREAGSGEREIREARGETGDERQWGYYDWQEVYDADRKLRELGDKVNKGRTT